MQETLIFSTNKKQEFVDITERVRALVAQCPEATLCSVYARGATAAVMVQENWDPNIGTDIINCLSGLIPPGKWIHDRIDGNADAHIKAGIVGPSETIPVKNGQLLLSRWQNIFFCDFDGPRQQREVVVTVL